VYAAELDAAGVVLRVIVVSDLAWPAVHLGGTWAECGEPDGSTFRLYPGPGWGHDGRWGRRFAAPWRRPDVDWVNDDPIGGYQRGDVAWDGTRIVICLRDGCVLAPGEGDWHATPVDDVAALPAAPARRVERWTLDTNYVPGDLVWALEGMFRCVNGHRARLVNRPAAGTGHWSLLIARGG
jgi:hypothetical protein